MCNLKTSILNNYFKTRLKLIFIKKTKLHFKEPMVMLIIEKNISRVECAYTTT